MGDESIMPSVHHDPSARQMRLFCRRHGDQIAVADRGTHAAPRRAEAHRVAAGQQVGADLHEPVSGFWWLHSERAAANASTPPSGRATNLPGSIPAMYVKTHEFARSTQVVHFIFVMDWARTARQGDSQGTVRGTVTGLSP